MSDASPPSRPRWIRIGTVRSDWFVFRWQWGVPGGLLMAWVGRTWWCQPVEFVNWPELLGAVRTRLGCAGLEMEAVASAWPRTEWVELWVLVRRRAAWTRAKVERKRYAVI